jgi:hypothetical protein
VPRQLIRVRGARQNNLNNLDLDLPIGELIVVTGASGSGKSSLAVDTLYAEGQHRYVETFSPYAHRFLDCTDAPSVERVGSIPPAIAIDQTNPVRTSRSTVGTMTELDDHLKPLFARANIDIGKLRLLVLMIGNSDLEQALLPALKEAGEAVLVERTLNGHARLRTLAVEPTAKHRSAFADQLRDHIRFEEPVLFQRAETDGRRSTPGIAALSEAVQRIDESARRMVTRRFSQCSRHAGAAYRQFCRPV